MREPTVFEKVGPGRVQVLWRRTHMVGLLTWPKHTSQTPAQNQQDL